ncbi:response regulator transcription factor [Acaryochloris sp. CCMEE 5410]|uniref:response regulator transcription factor n=1 Tax=Acaryochloris sp. CCMEE 5410 TaxID=310037 RepID=UPI0002EAC6DF|nr:response regulator [Acaryochloris sp. CCMEE 5410]
MLVEDEVRIAQLVELELSDAGYQVNIAHDGQVGLELAQAIQPDAIVLDWTLPNLTGLEICQHLRAAGNAVPIVFATAMDDPPHRQAAMAAGANAYVVKPYSINDLMETLTAQLPSAAA